MPIRVPNPAELAELSLGAIRYRDSKGFVPTTWDTLPYRLACLSSEAYELEQAIETYRRSGALADLRAMFLELADVVLYSVTILADLGETDWTLRGSYHGGAKAWDSPERITRQLRTHIDQAFRAWRRGDQRDAQIAIGLVIVSAAHICDVCTDSGPCLTDWCFDKLDAMKARAPRHGQKDART